MEEDKKFSKNIIGKTVVSKTGKRFGEVGDVIFETRSGELIQLVVKNPTSYTGNLNLERTNIGELINTLQNTEPVFSDSPVFFPNPFTDKLSMKFQSDDNEKIRLQISDMQGRIILDSSFDLYKGNNEFDIDNLIIENQGLYLYRIWKNNSLTSGKLIKANP